MAQGSRLPHWAGISEIKKNLNVGTNDALS